MTNTELVEAARALIAKHFEAGKPIKTVMKDVVAKLLQEGGEIVGEAAIARQAIALNRSYARPTTPIHRDQSHVGGGARARAV